MGCKQTQTIKEIRITIYEQNEKPREKTASINKEEQNRKPGGEEYNESTRNLNKSSKQIIKT